MDVIIEEYYTDLLYVWYEVRYEFFLLLLFDLFQAYGGTIKVVFL